MNTEKLQKITSPEFVDFLRDEGALSLFIKNVNVDLLPDYRRKTALGYVFSAFTWDETKEGIVFWAKIDNKWREIVRNGNIKKDAHYEELCDLGAEDVVPPHVWGEPNLPDEKDMVNKPPHYELWDGTEAFDIIKQVLTPEELQGYLKGNVLKYRLRAGNKDNTQQDIDKANWYQNKLNEQS